jgi:hypothetical protein
MTPKTIKILYWTLTIIYCLMMLMDGIAGVMREKTGQEVMTHLGYPIYAMTIFGIAKIAGTIGLLQLRSKTFKEWAFAGFTINYIGAFASRLFVGDEVGLLILPLVLLAVTFIYYYIWKRFEEVRAQA